MRGYRGGAEAEHPAVRGGPGGEPSGCPCPGRTPISAGCEDGGMDYGAAINDKWDRTEYAGMTICPIPVI